MLERTLEYTLVGSEEPRSVSVPERDPLPGGDFRVLIEITGS
jgi:hypothetical protein